MTASGPNKNTEAICEMIDRRLKSISESAMAALPADSHLDEDTISAFIEGRLAAGESKPVLSHLTACGLCRSASAELLRLDEIAPDRTSQTAGEEPGRLQTFLSNLPSLILSPDEDVVFAYQNPPAEEKPEQPSAMTSEDEKTPDGS